MLDETRKFLLGEAIAGNEDEVNRQNRLAIRYFALLGLPVALANCLVQSAMEGAPGLVWNKLWLVAFFAVLLVADRWLIPERCRRSALIVYALCAPAMIVSILLGTVWDPTHQAITFLMYLLVTPLFVLDRPLRVMGVTLAWNVVFVLACLATKDPSVVRSDVLHSLQFYLMSIAVTCVVLRLRFDMLATLGLTRHAMEHDEGTGAQNRRCLEGRLGGYVGRPLIVALCDIDRFNRINDFYGHDAGNRVLKTLYETVSEAFGEEHTYRFGGDEFLVVASADDAVDPIERLERCKQIVSHERIEGIYTNLSCSFGYVVGTPKSGREFFEMAQLADIYAHRATHQGTGKTIGGPFDTGALRAGMVESNISTHAQAYEVNQLTGLPSVTYFTERGEELLSHIGIQSRQPVVGFFNVVRFREYNDEFGFAKGDELIRQLADLLRDVLPARHITYITGSQFGVLCYLDEVEPAVRHVNEGLARMGLRRPLEAKAGFAEYAPGDSIISLLDKAMLAHESIADQASVTYRMYDLRLDDELRFNQYLVTHVDDAIENGWLKVYYQPIVRSSDGSVCNLEALSRWVDPTYGFLPPLDFIGVLERERLIHKLSLFVVRQVMEDFGRLEAAGIRPMPVSVNLSRYDFLDRDMVSDIASIVDEAGYAHDLLNIEITESAFVDSTDFLKREVARFRELGFSVWMDDFGSEYSTLNLLQELDFDLVKIDMQFMRNFSANGRNGIIVSDIIDMCRRLGISTLVEGVELAEQHQVLRDMGSDKLQGYLFSKPRELTELVEEWQATGE